MPVKGCWTCKKRKILCDRTTPRCSNCTKSDRECHYGIRLSWPKHNDNKHAIVFVPPRRENFVSSTPNLRLVNASHWDIDLHYYLTSTEVQDQVRFTNFPLNRNVFWSPHQLEPSDNELLEHFALVGAKTLSTFSPDAVGLQNLVIRMALSDNTPSSTAVLHSLLALVQLHRYGCQAQTYKLAASAFRILTASSTTASNRHEATQHIVASMLLGSRHILQNWKKSEQWLWFICNAKNLVKAANLNWDLHESDMTTTMSWIYYHDTLGWLSLRHWRRHRSEEAAYVKDFHQQPKICKLRMLPHPATANYRILFLLHQLFTNTLDSSDSGYHSSDYRSYIKQLRYDLERFQGIPEIRIDDSTASENVTKIILELYRLAGLVYLSRISESFSRQSPDIDLWTGKAFSFMARLSAIDQPLPLFIFGCEARSEEHRAIVMDLISRSEQIPFSRSLKHVTEIVQSVWVQDDLAEGILDYKDKLDAIFGSMDVVPSLA